ncbi:hypothetical protein GJAV_G00127670 [Gymnothorax javanicus]|nr:hypothetical protein GJAV_G00127670 [Gymnothorax javanicus]
MSWQGYIDALLEEKGVADAAIFCCTTGTAWAAKPDGFLINAKPDQVLHVFCKERENLFSQGFQFGDVKCTMLRDESGEELPCVDARTKDDKRIGICFALSIKTIVVVAGSPHSTDSGNLNTASYNMAKHLKKSGF